MKNTKRFLIFGVIIGLIFAALGGYLANQKFQPATPKDQAVQKLMALTLKDSQAKPQALSQWQGKFLVVNFWATWCKPCVQEMPELEALQKKLAAENVQLLGIGIDSPSNVAEFAQQHHISYPLFAAGLEGTDLSSMMGNKAGGLPFTVLITADGTIAKTYMGRLKIEELENDIKAANKK